MFPHSSNIAYRHADLDGVRVFFRESRPERADAPVLLLLHGFPSGSHQFIRLMDALGSRYRVIAPDLPGFGHTGMPDGFVYSFDNLSEVMEGFIKQLGLSRFTMFVFDFGAPVGFRIAERHPDWIAGLVVQNGNAYKEGLSETARELLTMDPDDPAAVQTLQGLLTLQGTRSQYETGVADPSVIAPDGWTLDQHFLDLPGRKDAQLALLFDYHTNIASYGRWQEWLRRYARPTLIVWGRNDPFFIEPGARAYLRDLPGAELHLFDTGHFALETHVSEIAPLIDDFLDRSWS